MATRVQPIDHRVTFTEYTLGSDETGEVEDERGNLDLFTLQFRDAATERAYRFVGFRQWHSGKMRLLWALYCIAEAIFAVETLVGYPGAREGDESGGVVNTTLAIAHGCAASFGLLMLCVAASEWGQQSLIKERISPPLAATVLLGTFLAQSIFDSSGMVLLSGAAFTVSVALLCSLMFVEVIGAFAVFSITFTMLKLATPDVFVDSQPGIHHVWLLSFFACALAYLVAMIERVAFSTVRVMQAQHDSLANVMTTVVDPLIAVDSTGHIKASNPAAARLLGCTPAQLSFLDLDDLLVGGARKGEHVSFSTLLQRLNREDEAVVAGPQSMYASAASAPPTPARSYGLQGQRVDVRHRDGSHIAMSLSLGRSVQSKKPFYIVCLHDMSEYVRQKEQLERANVEREVLNRSTRTRREFLRYIFHEVRVPFNALIVGIETLINDLSKGSTSPASRMAREKESLETLTIMQEQSTAMRRILDDVLNMQKIEEAQFKLEKAPVQLRKMVFGVIRTFHQACVNQNITLEMEPDECPALDVIADQPRLQQVISNLMSNAVKFTPEYGTIKVRAYKVLEKKDSKSTLTPAPRSGARTPMSATSDGMAKLPPLRSSGAMASVAETKEDPVSGTMLPRGGGAGGPSDVSVATGLSATMGSAAPSLVVSTPPTAFSFDDEGGAASPKLPTEVTIRISVTDSGVGIRPEDRARLFTPYVQISAGELQKGKGTGLGLSIAKHIVEQHGGKIGCNSEPGVGSEFWLEIPFRIVYNAEVSRPMSTAHHKLKAPKRLGRRMKSPNRSSKSTSGGGTPAHSSMSDASSRSLRDRVLEDSKAEGSSPTRSRLASSGARSEASERSVEPPTVLLVEDSVANQKLTGRLIRQMGYGCDIAENGQVCLDMILPAIDRGEECPYPLIFMDREMPVMNGHQATRALRARGLDVPIIAITGNALQEDREQFLAAGATEVLTKPVRAADLRSVLATLMVE